MDAVARAVGDAAGANSDFYPYLDLTTEQARYEKRFSRGFAGLGLAIVVGTVLVILFAVMLPWFPATITVDTLGPTIASVPPGSSSKLTSRSTVKRWLPAEP